MGPVIADPCEHFRGLIALEVVGQLSTDERVALMAHTEGCPTLARARTTRIPRADVGNRTPCAICGAR